MVDVTPLIYKYIRYSFSFVDFSGFDVFVITVPKRQFIFPIEPIVFVKGDAKPNMDRAWGSAADPLA